MRVRQARAAARRVSLVMAEWWEFGAFWANTVKMGSEMGAPFARGLLHASGEEGKGAREASGEELG